MSHETHIASLVLRCDPARMAEVMPGLRVLPQTEIALEDASGKLVLLMETRREAAIAETLTTLQLMDGVASAALVYHHTLNDDEEEEGADR
jgi:periplasmic nitrate reductase NapD